jgi:hypothetical protein
MIMTHNKSSSSSPILLLLLLPDLILSYDFLPRDSANSALTCDFVISAATLGGQFEAEAHT